MSQPNSRAIAINVLCQWQKNHPAIDPLIDRQTKGLIEPRDRQLVKALVFGVLRNLNSLDFILKKFSKHPLAKMQPTALQALRTGLYQLLFMDRIPASAALNETIKALKDQHHPKWLTGFVNGLLRNAARQQDDIIKTLNRDDLPLTVRCNHPDWLLERWLARFGKNETLHICQANNQPAGLCLRINRNKIARETFLEELQQHNIMFRPGLVPEAVWLNESGAVDSLPGYKDGWFSVQDETAQLITYLLAPFNKANYLDACAGLGGKTMTLAQMAPVGSQIWAVEPQGMRQKLLQENLQRLGLQQINCFTGTLAEFSQKRERHFEAILLDAPCSGLGVTGRHPDIRWNRQPKDLPRFQELQLALLQTATKLLTPGGVLVYATCSMEPEENEEVIKLFLQGHPNFMLSNAKNHLPVSLKSWVNKDEFLRTKPGIDGTDGFFAARLENNCA